MTRRGTLAVACGATLTACACVHMRGPQDLRQRVGETFGVGLDQRVVLSMNTLALVTGPFPPEMTRALWHVEWFHAGTYRVAGGAEPIGAAALHFDQFEMDGWRRQMYAREFPREIMALVREDGDDIHDMAVLIHDGTDLTIVHLVGNIDRFLASRSGTDELLKTIDSLQLFFEHLGIAQAMLNTTAETHERNERKIREILTESGWLPAPPADDAHEAPPEPQGE